MESTINISGNYILTDVSIEQSLEAGVFKTYRAIAGHCHDKNYCWPSIATISEKAKRSIRSVVRDIKELVKLGYITKRRRGSVSNVYVVRGLLVWDAIKNAMVEFLGEREVTKTIIDEAGEEAPKPNKNKTWPKKKNNNNEYKKPADEYAINIGEAAKAMRGESSLYDIPFPIANESGSIENESMSDDDFNSMIK